MEETYILKQTIIVNHIELRSEYIFHSHLDVIKYIERELQHSIQIKIKKL